jgi:branched-chain amino acid transport system ATP-binding protein
MPALLSLDKFSAAYGEAAVVQDISLELRSGEIVALLGRNGMGKTTLLRGIMGLTPVRRGGLKLSGVDILTATPEVIARAGVGYVPADRGIFGSLSVRENLLMCARPPASGSQEWSLDRILTLFPRLAERLGHSGHHLSGGEQQMLAIGRALMTNPRLLLVDEATEGLAPLIARGIWKTLAEVCRSGVTAIIVDRDIYSLARIVSRVFVMFKGECAFEGVPDRLLGDRDLVRRYIGL